MWSEWVYAWLLNWNKRKHFYTFFAIKSAVLLRWRFSRVIFSHSEQIWRDHVTTPRVSVWSRTDSCWCLIGQSKIVSMSASRIFCAFSNVHHKPEAYSSLKQDGRSINPSLGVHFYVRWVYFDSGRSASSMRQPPQSQSPRSQLSTWSGLSTVTTSTAATAALTPGSALSHKPWLWD